MEAFRGHRGARGGAGLLLPPGCLGEGGVRPAAAPTPGALALLTRLQLVGATSRRASAPPLVTRPRADSRSPSAAAALAAARRSPASRPGPGRKAGGRVKCPRRSRNRSDQSLSASAWPARRSIIVPRLHKRRTRNVHAAGPRISGLMGAGEACKARPFQELVPRLILSLEASQLFGRLHCSMYPRPDRGSLAA